MSNSVEEIKELLYKAEEYQAGVIILTNALYELREEGGKVKFCIYTKSGRNNCTLDLSEKNANECLKVFIDGYNEQIRTIKKEINTMLDGMIDNV